MGAVLDVDWQALSAVTGAFVFLATLALAFATWKLARSSGKQAEAAQAQAKSSAELADVANRQLAVSSTAALRIRRDFGFGQIE